MSFTLNSKEICPFSRTCPHNNGHLLICKGADENRESAFFCDYINKDGDFIQGEFRSILDQTGKMKVILE
jgi:hypothetical protein